MNTKALLTLNTIRKEENACHPSRATLQIQPPPNVQVNADALRENALKILLAQPYLLDKLVHPADLETPTVRRHYQHSPTFRHINMPKSTYGSSPPGTPKKARGVLPDHVVNSLRPTKHEEHRERDIEQNFEQQKCLMLKFSAEQPLGGRRGAPSLELDTKIAAFDRLLNHASSLEHHNRGKALQPIHAPPTGDIIPGFKGIGCNLPELPHTTRCLQKSDHDVLAWGGDTSNHQSPKHLKPCPSRPDVVGYLIHPDAAAQVKLHQLCAKEKHLPPLTDSPQSKVHISQHPQSQFHGFSGLGSPEPRARAGMKHCTLEDARREYPKAPHQLLAERRGKPQ